MYKIYEVKVNSYDYNNKRELLKQKRVQTTEWIKLEEIDWSRHLRPEPWSRLDPAHYMAKNNLYINQKKILPIRAHENISSKQNIKDSVKVHLLKKKTGQAKKVYNKFIHDKICLFLFNLSEEKI